MKKYLFCFVSISVAAQHATGQEIPVSLQQQLENRAAVTGNEVNKEDAGYYQDLLYFRRHPVNINRADMHELQALHLLTDVQITNLIRYRSLLGPFADVHELQAVPGLDLFTINTLLPFIYAGPVMPSMGRLTTAFAGGEHTVALYASRVLELSKGYDTSLRNHYLGSPEHIAIEYRYRKQNALQYGLLADKDAGEQWFRGTQQRGFDFYSFHFFLHGKGVVKALALGDYSVNLGEGLVQWQSFALGKSVEITSVKKQGAILQPHGGTGEFSFNRGVAATLQYHQLESTVFASCRKYSTTTAQDTADFFPGFNTSGYHRTQEEVANRNDISDLSFGANLSRTANNTSVSANFACHNLSRVLTKRNVPYNFFSPQGSVFLNQSLSFHSTINNVYLFGEMAADRDLHFAMLGGVLASLDPKLDAALVVRDLGVKYQALFANSFGESFGTQNESGAYLNVSVRPQRNLMINTYADIFQFSWLRYRVSAPTTGSDYVIQMKLAPSSQTEINMAYQSKAKPMNATGSTATINFPENERRQQLRLLFSNKASHTLNWSGSVNIMWYQHADAAPEKGFLGALGTTCVLYRLRMQMRLQYFETDGYNSRIYTLENLMPQELNTSSYYGNGLSYLIQCKYNVSKKITADVVVSKKIYYGKTVVGSGLEEIQGNKKSTVSFLLTTKF